MVRKVICHEKTCENNCKPGSAVFSCLLTAFIMRLMLRPEWRLWPFGSFLGLLDLKSGVTVALLFVVSDENSLVKTGLSFKLYSF